jgi:hypothetical protein
MMTTEMGKVKNVGQKIKLDNKNAKLLLEYTKKKLQKCI